MNYGSFLNTIINFLIVAFAVFLLVRMVNRWTTKPAGTRGAHNEGLPAVRYEHSDSGQALRSLHDAARVDWVSALKGNSLRAAGYLKRAVFSSTDFLRGVPATV